MRTAVTLLLALSWAACVHGADFQGIPGCEKPSTRVVDKTTCHLYEKYAVLTQSARDNAGSDIIVNRNQQDSKACAWDEKAALLLLKNTDADYFFGLLGKLIFVDSGTGPSPRTLKIYDIEKSTAVYNGLYNESITIKNGKLSYWAATAKQATKENCPQLAQWSSQGLGAALEEKIFVELSSLKSGKTGKSRCSARQ
ncbi:MAG TPA: hypothetical protein PLL10_05595 [Elusimicrobiales bacterium]|nr:hypothetical protein [Elusimicrobiales bacterium]